jgi:hypothetical protein
VKFREIRVKSAVWGRFFEDYVLFLDNSAVSEAHSPVPDACSLGLEAHSLAANLHSHAAASRSAGPVSGSLAADSGSPAAKVRSVVPGVDSVVAAAGSPATESRSPAAESDGAIPLRHRAGAIAGLAAVEAGWCGAKKLSGQGALLLRDGFRKNF